MDEINEPWPVPSVQSFSLVVPGKGPLLTLTGSDGLIGSYLDRFGCVPVFDGNPPRRWVARPNELGGWDLLEPDGSTAFEQPPQLIRGKEAQVRWLTDRSWYHVGFSVQRRLTEFDLGEDGEGYSRHVVWGFDTIVPTVYDTVWRFEVEENLLHVVWDTGGKSRIPFVLKSQLKIGHNIEDASLVFYNSVLEVESPLFPPNTEFSRHLLKEYWGKTKNQRGAFT